MDIRWPMVIKLILTAENETLQNIKIRMELHEGKSLNGKNNDKNISYSPLATEDGRICEQRKMKIHYKEQRHQ